MEELTNPSVQVVCSNCKKLVRYRTVLETIESSKCYAIGEVKLIRTDDPYTDLKPGDRGTVVDVTELPYEDTPFKVWVQWDRGSRLGILEGHADYMTVDDDDDE